MSYAHSINFFAKKNELKGHNSVKNYSIHMKFSLWIENVLLYNFYSLSGIKMVLVFEIFTFVAK